MRYSLEVVTPPEYGPMTVDYIKDLARIDTAQDDQKLERLLLAAVDYVGDMTGRKFLNTVMKQHTDDVPDSSVCWIPIHCCPVVSITDVTYVDADGDTQTWAASNYETDLVSEPARIKPAVNQVWPTVRQNELNAFTIQFTAGYGDEQADMPDKVKHLLATLVAHWYHNPEAITRGGKELPFTITALIDNLRWDIP